MQDVKPEVMHVISSRGRTAMRISVSSWATTDEDVEKSLEAILRCARGVA